MNHDATHCSDYTQHCPKSCYRAQLTADLMKRSVELAGIPMSWSRFGETDSCPLNELYKEPVNPDPTDKLLQTINELTAEVERYKKLYLKFETDATNLTGELMTVHAKYKALLEDVQSYQGSICCYCANLVRDAEQKKIYCKRYDKRMPMVCGNWEWRGVQG